VKSLELKKKREGLLAEMDKLANKAEKLTDEESTRWEDLQKEVDGLNKEIRLEEQRENHLRLRAAGSEIELSKTEERDLQQYSFVKALAEFLRNGRLSGLELEMHQEAQKEMAAFGEAVGGFGISQKVLRLGGHKRADITTGSAPLVPTDIVGFIDALYAKMFCVKLGAQTMSGLTGDVSIPRVATKATAGWATEVADASDAGSDTESVSLTPKRLTCYQDISKLLIFQSPMNVEQLVRNLFIMATQVTADAAFIAGAANGPTGLLATDGIGAVAGGTDGAAPTLANLLSLIKEVSVDDADIGSLAFLTNPYVRYKLQTTPIVTGLNDTSNFYGYAESAARIWPVDVADRLIGYNAAVSTQVPHTLEKGGSGAVCSAIIFGNWLEMIIAQFGAFDVTVDPLSQAIGNKVRVVINSFWDSALRHPASFAAMKDALTT